MLSFDDGNPCQKGSVQKDEIKAHTMYTNI